MTTTSIAASAGDPTDSRILQIEQNIKWRREQYRAAYDSSDEGPSDALHDRLSEAEMALCRTPAHTGRGALAKLWAASAALIDSVSDDAESYVAATRADPEALEQLEWGLRFIAAATGDLGRQLGLDPAPPVLLERMADKPAPVETVGSLCDEWRRLEDAKGRADAEVETDADRQAELERLIAERPATTLREAASKLAVLWAFLGGDTGRGKALADSVIADLDALALGAALDHPAPAGEGGADPLFDAATGFEVIAGKTDAYAKMLANHAEAMGDTDEAEGLYATVHFLQWLRDDLDAMRDKAMAARKGGAA